METEQNNNAVQSGNSDLDELKKNADFWMSQYYEEKRKFEALQKAIQGLSDISKLV